MWWVGFAVINWLGVVYMKERGPEILKPAPISTNMMSPLYLLLMAMYAVGLYGLGRIAWKWIKKRV